MTIAFALFLCFALNRRSGISIQRVLRLQEQAWVF